MALQLLIQLLDLTERGFEVANDCGGNIFRLCEPLFGFSLRVPQPGNVEIVVAFLDLLAREAAEAAFLAFILRFDLP